MVSGPARRALEFARRLVFRCGHDEILLRASALAFSTVVSLVPLRAVIWYFVARTLKEQVNTLEEVIQFLPTFKDALNLMVECYEQMGEGAKAEHCYLKAISTDPNGIIIHGMLDGSPQEAKKEERIKH